MLATGTDAVVRSAALALACVASSAYALVRAGLVGDLASDGEGNALPRRTAVRAGRRMLSVQAPPLHALAVDVPVEADELIADTNRGAKRARVARRSHPLDVVSKVAVAALGERVLVHGRNIGVVGLEVNTQ